MCSPPLGNLLDIERLGDNVAQTCSVGQGDIEMGDGLMNRLHTVWRGFVLILSVITMSVLLTMTASFSTVGYDASFTLAWGRDFAAGLPLDFSHPSSPTPHPLALIGGWILGLLPGTWAVFVTIAFSCTAVLFALLFLGLFTYKMGGSRVAAFTAVACAGVSAPLWLLVVNASHDIAYIAISLGAVSLTLRRQHTGAVTVFMIAALLRPEAALFAFVPLTQAMVTARATRLKDHTRPAWTIRAVWTFIACVLLAAAAWLAMGAAGGDPFIALHSASTNAALNDNPRGLLTALTSTLPGLASPSGWPTIAAATITLIWAVYIHRSQQHPQRPTPPHRTINQVSQAPGPAHQHVVTIGIFIGIAIAAYLAQGLLGTPLVARYLLLPALLCTALATQCIPLIATRVRHPRRSLTTAASIGVLLIATSTVHNIAGWKDLTLAHHTRTDVFTAAHELLHTDLAQRCDAPFVVRSPAMVAITALSLNRPLSDIVVADHPDTGVLLQPLTHDAATLAGYGPLTPLEQQATFPTDSPPRGSNAHWALYSTCQP